MSSSWQGPQIMYGLSGCSHVFRMVHGVDAFTGTAAVHQNDRLPTVGLSLLAFTFDFGNKEIKTFFWRMGGEPWFQISLFFFSTLQGLTMMAFEVQGTACSPALVRPGP